MRRGRRLASHLDETADEVRISRMWSNIRDRRERPRGRGPFVVGLLAASALAAAGALWLWPTPGPLALASGEAPSVVEASAASRTLSFDDGSEIRLEAGARLETVEDDGDRFGVLLARGRARFSVTPGGPRRWVVEGGLATVEVVGTVFSVARDDASLRVEVERGVVLVWAPAWAA